MLFFLIGVTVRSYFGISLLLFFIGLLAAIIFLAVARKGSYFQYAALCIFCLSLGVLRYQLSVPAEQSDRIWFYNGQTVVGRGVVAREPDIRIDQTKLSVRVTQIQTDRQHVPVGGTVLMSVGLYPEFRYGDSIEFRCQLKKPAAFNGFAYDRYLARYRIYSVCYFPQVTLVSHDAGNTVLASILGFKANVQYLINRNLPEPHASLFAALLLGSRRGIPDLLNEQFSITGTTHLIAISGSHITVITAVLLELLLAAGLWRKQAFWIITLLLVLYVVLIGFPASAVRAAVMGWLVLLAMQLARLNQPANLIMLAATAMAAVNPLVLRDDIGFQLSFAAVIGIIYLVPTFDRWLWWLPAFGGIRSVLSMTLAAQLATLPLIVFHFGRISLIGVIANLLVVPIFTWLLIGGFIALALSFVLPPLSQFFFWPIWLLINYAIAVVGLLARVPFAALNI